MRFIIIIFRSYNIAGIARDGYCNDKQEIINKSYLDNYYENLCFWFTCATNLAFAQSCNTLQYSVYFQSHLHYVHYVIYNKVVVSEKLGIVIIISGDRARRICVGCTVD